MSLILGGVGLGVCSACNAPGAFWYPNRIDLFPHSWPGVWICDSCQWTIIVHDRIQADLKRVRSKRPDSSSNTR